MKKHSEKTLILIEYVSKGTKRGVKETFINRIDRILKKDNVTDELKGLKRLLQSEVIELDKEEKYLLSQLEKPQTHEPTKAHD